MVWSPRDSFTSRVHKARIGNVGFFSLHGAMQFYAVGCPMDKRTDLVKSLCFLLLFYQSGGLACPLTALGRREVGPFTNCSCSDLRQHCKAQEKVTFVQSSFGPDLLFVKVTCICLAPAGAAAPRTSPLCAGRNHFSRVVCEVVFTLHCRRLFGLG